MIIIIVGTDTLGVYLLLLTVLVVVEVDLTNAVSAIVSDILFCVMCRLVSRHCTWLLKRTTSMS